MINESGYVLITMTFVMVSFLSIVFLLFYPLAREARKDSGFYIIDRNDYRYRKALFGEVVDQCGTKLAHCGSLYGDYPYPGEGGTQQYLYHTRVRARIFGTLGAPNRLEIPREYQFTEDHFWSGYRGKGYLNLLPSDKWGYDTLYGGVYDPFLQPYAAIYMKAICGGGAWGFSYGNYAKNAVIKGKCSSCTFMAPGRVIVELKDYSENRNSHELRLVLTGSNNASANMFFESESGYPEDYPDYRLYAFKQYLGGNYGTRLAADAGQKKLIVQVRKNPDDPWITRDTGLISLPTGESSAVRPIFRVNFYG